MSLISLLGSSVNAVGLGGSGGGDDDFEIIATPAPTVPTFNALSATQITAGQDVAAIVAAGSEGDHFDLLPGFHDIDNCLVKSGMHIRFLEGAQAVGTNKGYCFRPWDADADDVVIGGIQTAATRPIISDYGNGTTNQGYGAIMGRTDDILNNQYIREDVSGWFIYGLEFRENSAMGVKLGSHFTVFDCDFSGHSVNAINGDRVVGGLIHSNIFHWNALNPATGTASNGAHIKFTWVNADEGRTDNTPVDRTKATAIISSNSFWAYDQDGTRQGTGTTSRAVWLDLDCQDVIVEYNSMDDHSFSSIYFEGCNYCRAWYNTIFNSDGFGVALNQDFISAAAVVAESNNCWIYQNTFNGCNIAMANRLSNRTADWLNTSSDQNYADSTGDRYWIDDGMGAILTTDTSNVGTADNLFSFNTLVNCNIVMINEGTDTAGQTVQGQTGVNIDFEDNDYTGSPDIEFFNASLTSLDLAAWQGIGQN